MLLTATPHMGKPYPYFALWRLLEPDAISTPEALEAFPKDRRARHFIRRTKEEMVKLDGSPLYPQRVCHTLGFELTDEEQELFRRNQPLHSRRLQQGSDTQPLGGASGHVGISAPSCILNLRTQALF